MNHRRCDRIWQAEAREDRRLDKRDLLSFERHAAHCADCTTEIAVLQGITQKMATLPEVERTDLQHRRARRELLRRANEQFLAEKPAKNQWKMWTLAGAFAIGLSIFFWLRTERTSAQGPVFDVVNMTHAVWQTETNASTSRVKLQAGSAAFHVEHLQNEAHFYVDMPDGQIEVRGTRFVVDVVEGKTRSVVVTEGIVWLDVPSFHGLLRAGERWPVLEKAAQNPPEDEKVSPNDSPSSENQNKPMVEAAVPAISPTPGQSAKMNSVAPTKVPIVAEKPTNETENSTIKEEPGPRFAEAMAAFTSGDDAQADQLFAAFVRDFPRDGRAEDATFLRAKARARRGDNAGAAAVAREYLRAFPRGLRRPEMERLAGETK